MSTLYNGFLSKEAYKLKEELHEANNALFQLPQPSGRGNKKNQQTLASEYLKLPVNIYAFTV